MLYLQLFVVLLAFAANSLLCRWALDVYQFDAALFSLIRLASGALMLTLLLTITNAGQRFGIPWRSGRFWKLGAGLVVYALGFSWAYLKLDTGVGAFILFATVQVSMQLVAFRQGERLTGLQWFGIIVSFVGLAWLLLPGAEAPELFSSLLMFIAALGWSWFVVLGKQSGQPLRDVQLAFVSATMFMLLLFPLTLDEWLHWSPQPWGLAMVSGVLASGLGYFLWYRILPLLGLGKAAQYQLLVPVIALLMGMTILGEAIGFHTALAMSVIICGVAISTLFGTKKTR